MGIIEAILTGLQFKGLQKPLVFFSMPVGFIAFSMLGIVVIAAAVEGIQGQGEPRLLARADVAGFSLLFFGLAAACGYFIKRCFD